jgi:secreted PhoX family phosphatase
MSHLTDKARGVSPGAQPRIEGQMFEDVLAQAPMHRRAVLRGGVGASLAALFGGALSACGGGGGSAAAGADAQALAAPVVNPGEKFAVGFQAIARSTADLVKVPDGYTAEVLFAAGDAVVPGASPFTGAFLSSAQAELVAGGNHDGMHFYPLSGVNPNRGGLLAINHEFPDFNILMSGSYDAATASAEQKRIALSAVGVSVIEVEARGNQPWRVKANSPYNRRYSGNTVFGVSGPAASAIGPTVVGTLNNCASGTTPWGTYLTCEETTDNYLDPTRSELGYGWVVEIDPYGELAGLPVKRTALGRFDHENTACAVDGEGRVAIYMGDDGTPGCIYKFVPDGRVHATNRAANAALLDQGTLYVARFEPDGTGRWLALVQGQNGLVPGAVDPGNETQGAAADTPIDFATQADVLINTKAAARVAGATLMDRPEWITVAPDGTRYCTLTNNAGRQVTDPANPRRTNRHGHIVSWREAGNRPDAATFEWSVTLLAGDPSLADENLKGNIVGDTFSSPDGIDVDPQDRMWVQTDMSTSSANVGVFGNNAMYHVDPANRSSSRFLVGPVGCEITGLTYTPDLTAFFINIQHPTERWPSNEQGNDLPPRSATIVVRRNDGKPVGA